MSSNIKIERICEYCGGQFTARKTVTKYCSHKCNQRAYKERLRNDRIAKVEMQVKNQLAIPIEVIDKKPYLSIAEVCGLLGICRKTLYNIINKGELEISKIGNRTIIKRGHIDELLGRYTIVGSAQTHYYTVDEIEHKYFIKYSRLNEIVIERNIPQKLIKNRLYLSKDHIDAYFVDLAADVNKIVEWYSVGQLTVKYGQSRDSIYKLAKHYNIPKQQVGRFVYLSKCHFDELGLVPMQNEIEI